MSKTTTSKKQKYEAVRQITYLGSVKFKAGDKVPADHPGIEELIKAGRVREV